MSERIWTDTSSRSQNDTPEQRATVTSVTTELIVTVGTHKVSRGRLSVHRYHFAEPDRWYMSVYGMFSVDREVLESKDLEDAKAEALRRFRGRLLAVAEGIEPIAPRIEHAPDEPIVTDEEFDGEVGDFDWYNLIDGGYIDPKELLTSGADRVEKAIRTLTEFRDALTSAGIISG